MKTSPLPSFDRSIDFPPVYAALFLRFRRGIEDSIRFSFCSIDSSQLVGFDQSLPRSKERVSSFLVRIELIGSTDKAGNRLVDVWNFGKGRLKASLREFETF